MESITVMLKISWHLWPYAWLGERFLLSPFLLHSLAFASLSCSIPFRMMWICFCVFHFDFVQFSCRIHLYVTHVVAILFYAQQNFHHLLSWDRILIKRITFNFISFHAFFFLLSLFRLCYMHSPCALCVYVILQFISIKFSY